jgi:hypothetical protein
LQNFLGSSTVQPIKVKPADSGTTEVGRWQKRSSS